MGIQIPRKIADLIRPDATAAAAKTALGLDSLENTSDLAKPVSTATQTALNLKSPLASPTFTGAPAAPTATGGTNTAQLATTAFVASAVSTLATVASVALKATDTAVVHNTGTETIAGAKTFSTAPVLGAVSGILKGTSGTLTAATAGTDYAAATHTHVAANVTDFATAVDARIGAAVPSVTATGTVTSRTLAARFGETLNARDFGAVGDGTADDTAALTAWLAACTAGTTALLPRGTYLTGSLTVPAGVTLKGANRATLKLKAAVVNNTTDTRLVKLAAADSAMVNVWLDGNKAGNPGPAAYSTAVVTITGADRAVMRNCRITAATNVGVYAYNSADVSIVENVFTAVDDNVVFAQNQCQRIDVSRNKLSGMKVSGIKIHSGDGPNPTVRLDGPTVCDNIIDYRGQTLVYSGGVEPLAVEFWGGTAGTEGQGVIGGTICRNKIWGPTGGSTQPAYGISIGSGSDHVCSENHVFGPNIGLGLEAANTVRVIFSANRVDGTVLGGSVSNTFTGQIKFLGNVFRNVSSYGIQGVDTATELSIVGNTFIDAGTRAVFLNNAGANSLISGNQFFVKDLTADCAIYLLGSGCGGTMVAGNLFRPIAGTSASVSRIITNGAVNVTVRDNDMDTTNPLGATQVDTGIVFDGGSGNRAERNTIRNGVNGIYGLASATCRYIDNSFPGCATGLQAASDAVVVRLRPMGSAAPITGTYVAGDQVLNSAPTSGGYVGWVCTAGGAPGTWKTFGLIS